MYLGMYAAFIQKGIFPDVVMGSCGGSIAAAAVHMLPDPKDLQAWIFSRDVYRYWQSFDVNGGGSAWRAVGAAIGRYVSGKPCEDPLALGRQSLFKVPQMPFLLPANIQPDGPDVVILGARYLPQGSEAAHVSGWLWQETVYCYGEKLAKLLMDAPSAMVGSCYPNSLVHPKVAVRSDLPLDVSVDISVRDPYYFESRQWKDEVFMGGAINLMPIELAHRLADCVVIEHKAPADSYLFVPAWRRVWGVDANVRIHHVNAQFADWRVDTRDFRTASCPPILHKKMDWLSGRLGFQAPATHGAYVQIVQQQWEYGYAQAMASIESKL